MIHVGAIAAPWTFTWSGLALVIALHWLCGGIGICLGYHRLLTHGGFGCPRWVRRGISMIGLLAGEGPPLLWVANHRLHQHVAIRKAIRIHRDGAWWSHVFWLAYRVGGRDTAAYYRKWAPDLQRDRFMRGLEYGFLPLNLALTAVLGFAGYMIGGQSLAFHGWFGGLRSHGVCASLNMARELG